MNLATLRVVAFLVATHAPLAVTVAQQWEIRRLEGGLLHVQAEEGLSLIIQPNRDAVVPEHLRTQPSFALGSEFDRTLLRLDGTPPGTPSRRDAGEPIPPDLVSIESTQIGIRRAGIQLKTDGLNLVFASVDLMSDQSWITTHRNQDIHVLVLTFEDASRLMTARMNLWVGLVKAQQIVLNPTEAMAVDSAEEFSDSIGKQRVLPIGVLPVLTLPQSGLEFGDRQVILLEVAS